MGWQKHYKCGMSIQGPGPSSSYSRIVPLTSIRFFAAVLVVIYHFGRTTWPFDSGFLHKVTQCAASAVAFFFFLSGFILAHVYHRARWEEPGVAKRYYVSRLARIYPIYLTALVAQFLLEFFAAYIDRLTVVGKMLELQTHVLMIQAWLPSYVMTLNIPGWSLSVEASFYLLFPLIIRRIMDLKKETVLPAFLVLFLGSQGLFWTMRTVIWGDYYFSNPEILRVLLYHPLVYYPVFILGVLAFRLEQAWHRSGESHPQWMALLSLVSALAITLLSYWAGGYMTYGIHVGMLAPVYGALIYSLCEDRNWVARLLSGRIFSELGEASYSVYILQLPVFGLLGLFASGPKDGAFFYVYLAVLVALSWGLYRWYETPIRFAIRKKLG